LSNPENVEAPIRRASDPLLTRKQQLYEIQSRGYPMSDSYWNKINLPSVGAGPPVSVWFGKRPLTYLSVTLEWAEKRCSSKRSKLVA
jgi:hypothetical protein